MANAVSKGAERARNAAGKRRKAYEHLIDQALQVDRFLRSDEGRAECWRRFIESARQIKEGNS